MSSLQERLDQIKEICVSHITDDMKKKAAVKVAAMKLRDIFELEGIDPYEHIVENGLESRLTPEKGKSNE